MNYSRKQNNGSSIIATSTLHGSFVVVIVVVSKKLSIYWTTPHNSYLTLVVLQVHANLKLYVLKTYLSSRGRFFEHDVVASTSRDHLTLVRIQTLDANALDYFYVFVRVVSFVIYYMAQRLFAKFVQKVQIVTYYGQIFPRTVFRNLAVYR